MALVLRMIIGYARVSTKEQNLSGQVAELTAAGCVKVYREKASGARGDTGPSWRSCCGGSSPATFYW
jgi:DNA invertase Pin-like site-specific DNA recombinase